MSCSMKDRGSKVKEYKLMQLHVSPDNRHGLPCTNALKTCAEFVK
jgi:hypothetical protein